jgi:DNA repair exonuclease SbcCD ATPase subunit
MAELHDDIEEDDDVEDTPPDKKTDSLVRKLRDENAQRRVKQRDAEKKLADLQAEFEGLQSTIQGLTTARDEAESARKDLEKQLKDVDTSLTARNKGVIETLPQDFQAIVPSGMSQVDLAAWLDKITPLVIGKRQAPPPEGNAGRPSPDGSAELTSEELAIVKKMGITAEQYAQNKRDHGN